MSGSMRTQNRLPTVDTFSVFDKRVSVDGEQGLMSADRLRVLQVNIGLRCNLTCGHCHVNSSPKRKEEMDWSTMESTVGLAKTLGCETVDITGGAPEMNPNFRGFVSALRAADFAVIVRSNLTIMLEEGYEDLPSFYRDHAVRLVASLPCYGQENVDQQRGAGVYVDSIEVIRRLNRAGYGVEPELPLTLVYNPVGLSLPPSQGALEEDYRRELGDRLGIYFTNLITITNIPIGRFRTDLRRQNQLGPYLETLSASFNRDTVSELMCRHQVSVAWDGTLYDCDFNLALRIAAGFGKLGDVHDVDVGALVNRRIVTGDHCYACTAGAGSSCGGALV